MNIRTRKFEDRDGYKGTWKIVPSAPGKKKTNTSVNHAKAETMYKVSQKFLLKVGSYNTHRDPRFNNKNSSKSVFSWPVF